MFQSWMVSPWLFLGGSLFVLSPLLIHLLSKRRFRTVEWAAMDFLLVADQRNRRRVQLENLLLLLLRCLAVLLIALLVARPFWPRGLSGGSLDWMRFERIVLLDDSPSMAARAGVSTTFESAKQELCEFVRGIAASASDDSFTLVLTSRPHRPLVADMPVNAETAVDIMAQLRQLEVTDRVANFEDALREIEKTLEKRSTSVNRVVYVISDMRRHDWAGDEGDKLSGVVETLRQVSRRSSGCFLIDLGDEEVGNLFVSGVIPQEKVLVAGLPVRFEVSVTNSGPTPVRNVQVKFTAGESLPLTGQIDVIPAGRTASIPFTYTFSRPDVSPSGTPISPVPVRAEVLASQLAASDRILADNVRFYAARLVDGIPVLVVDGDPSATFGRAESFFLQRALAPPGDTRSGVTVQSVTEADLRELSFDPFVVVFLCNLYRLSDQRLQDLQRWVETGGGLVILAGDQVDEQFYNERLHRQGRGLMPVRLESVRDTRDAAENAWGNFVIQPTGHPVLQIFEGQNNPLLEGVKIFRWWHGSVAQPGTQSDGATVVAQFSNAEKSPAMVEKAYGQGRVMAITTAADMDWGNWPQDPSYVITMQELCRYLARKTVEQGSIVVGEPIRQPLDLTRYKLDVSLVHPDQTRSALQPREIVDEPEGASSSIWSVDFDRTDRRGFYQMQLTRNSGEPENVLFAANIDLAEANLQRVNLDILQSRLANTPVTFVRGSGLLALMARDAKRELSLLVLGMLGIVLCTEHVLAWWFGLRR